MDPRGSNPKVTILAPVTAGDLGDGFWRELVPCRDCDPRGRDCTERADASLEDGPLAQDRTWTDLRHGRAVQHHG